MEMIVVEREGDGFKYTSMSHEEYLAQRSVEDWGRACELDYRRGYYHGFITMIEYIERGYSLAKCIKFFDGPLRQWRYHERPVRMLIPPEICDRKGVK